MRETLSMRYASCITFYTSCWMDIREHGMRQSLKRERRLFHWITENMREAFFALGFVL